MRRRHVLLLVTLIVFERLRSRQETCENELNAFTRGVSSASTLSVDLSSGDSQKPEWMSTKVFIEKMNLIIIFNCSSNVPERQYLHVVVIIILYAFRFCLFLSQFDIMLFCVIIKINIFGFLY